MDGQLNLFDLYQDKNMVKTAAITKKIGIRPCDCGYVGKLKMNITADASGVMCFAECPKCNVRTKAAVNPDFARAFWNERMLYEQSYKETK